MSTIIILLHVIVCILLIFIVLLQTGRGADIGAAFGGGSSQTLFGSTGASSFLTKMTTVAAVVFMLTSLSLAYFSSRRPTSSIMPDSVPVTEEAQEVPAQTQEGQGVPAETPIKPEPTSEPLESTTQQSAVPAQASEWGE